jgi:hypothetical protein
MKESNGRRRNRSLTQGVYFFVYRMRIHVYEKCTLVYNIVYIVFTKMFTCVQTRIHVDVERCVQVCVRCKRKCIQRLRIVYNFTLSFLFVWDIEESSKLLYSYTREVRYISSLTSKLIE